MAKRTSRRNECTTVMLHVQGVTESSCVTPCIHGNNVKCKHRFQMMQCVQCNIAVENKRRSFPFSLENQLLKLTARLH